MMTEQPESPSVKRFFTYVHEIAASDNLEYADGMLVRPDAQAFLLLWHEIVYLLELYLNESLLFFHYDKQDVNHIRQIVILLKDLDQPPE